MKLINEQDLTLDDLFKAGEEAVKTPINPIKKPKVNQDDNKPKPDDDKPKPPKPDDDKPQPPKPQQNDITKYQGRSLLISNSILCFEILNRATSTSNWDETLIQKTMIKYVFNRRVNAPEYQAMYMYILYRILSPAFKSNRTKFKKQYNYWINRNLAVATTYDSLIALKNSYITNFIDWFRGRPFDWIDWEISDMNFYFEKIFNQPINSKKLYSDPQSSKLTLKKTISDTEIHSMIIDMYNKNAFGVPGGERKNVKFPGQK